MADKQYLLKGFTIPKRPSSEPLPMPPHILSKIEDLRKSKNFVTSYLPGAYDRQLPQEVLSKCREDKCDLCNVTLPSQKLARNHYNGKRHRKKEKKFLDKMVKESVCTCDTGSSPKLNYKGSVKEEIEIKEEVNVKLQILSQEKNNEKKDTNRRNQITKAQREVKKELALKEYIEKRQVFMGTGKVNLGEVKTQRFGKFRTGPKALPAEMLMRVFRCLGLQDLKMIVLVSQRWRIIGEDPSLWKSYMFIVQNRDHLNMMFIGRFQRIQAIRIKSRYNCEELFQELIKIPRDRVKEIDFNRLQLSSVEPRLFVKLLTRLEAVNLIGTNTTVSQNQKLLTALSQNSQLKKLEWSGNIPPNFVEAKIFARAITRLEVVDLRTKNHNLMSIQKQELFNAITSQDCQLKKLKLNVKHLSSVKSAILAEAVAKMEEVDFGKTVLSVEQVTWILAHVLEGTKLKKLVLRERDTADTSPHKRKELARRWASTSQT